MEQEVRLKHQMPVQLRFSDVDQFGHVNNSVYFSLYDLAKTTYIKDILKDISWEKVGIVVANINANFFSPVFLDDNIVIDTSIIHLGNKSFTLLQRALLATTGEVKCECKTVMVLYDIVALEPIAIPMEYKLAIANYEEKTVEELSKSE